MAKNQYKKEPLKNNVEEMFIGPFGSSLKNECFVDEEDAYCMVYEQKHAIQKTLDGKNRFVDKNKYYELKRFTIKPGDIIVSCRGTIGETFIVPENAPLGIMHPSIMKIRLKPNVYNIEYFNLLLKNRLKDYNKSANGSGIKMAISATELGKELFPIPPMDEQQKTSKIFLMVNHLILLRKQQLAKLDELVKARFVEMFLLHDYPTKTLDELSIGKGEYGAQSASTEYDSTRPRYVRITDVNEDGTLNDDKVSSENITDDEQYRLSYGDFMFARMGATVGKTYAFLSGNQIFAGYLIRYKLNLSLANPRYLFWYTKLDDYQKWVKLNQSGAAQPGINAKKYGSLKIPVPPIALQNQFAAFVERVDQQKQTVQQSLEKLELMKKALMQEYFG